MLVAHFGTDTPDDAVFARWAAGLSAQGRDMVARVDAGLPALWDEQSSPAVVRDALAVLAPIVELPPAAAPLAVLVRLDALLYGGSS